MSAGGLRPSHTKDFENATSCFLAFFFIIMGKGRGLLYEILNLGNVCCYFTPDMLKNQIVFVEKDQGQSIRSNRTKKIITAQCDECTVILLNNYSPQLDNQCIGLEVSTVSTR